MTAEPVAVPCPRHSARFMPTWAYRGPIFDAAVAAHGGTPRIVQTGMWGRPGDDTLRKLRR